MRHQSLSFSFLVEYDTKLSEGTKKDFLYTLPCKANILQTPLTILKLLEKQREKLINPLQIAATNVDEAHYTLCVSSKLSFYGSNT